MDGCFSEVPLRIKCLTVRHCVVFKCKTLWKRTWSFDGEMRDAAIAAGGMKSTCTGNSSSLKSSTILRSPVMYEGRMEEAPLKGGRKGRFPISRLLEFPNPEGARESMLVRACGSN